MEFFRPKLVKIRYKRCLEQLCVKLGDTINRMTADDRQISHADLLLSIFFNNRHASHAIRVSRPYGDDFIQESLVNLIYDLKVARQNILQQRNWPFLQSLWQ